MIQRDLSQILPSLSHESEFSEYKRNVIYDYWLAVVSRECSVLGRKEVLTGKAKFGIVGDGKEVAQIAMAKAFKLGDWRSGYYRDQTLVMALGLCSVEDFFAQLYADTENDPFSGGRQMNSHFATTNVDKEGHWVNTTNQFNSSSDISCTAGQMGRALGIALASSYYRNINVLNADKFTKKGDEISFVTIGDASTSEGAFWETMNAASVMKVPLLCAVWDDGFGISVPIELQTTKASISEAMQGFLINDKGEGMYIFTAKAWDYQEMCAVFDEASRLVRKNHIPALVHIQEVTQPQGHSTSGSHERYKSKERLDWEKDFDCNKKMAEWMILNALATEDEIEKINSDAKEYVKACKNKAWSNYTKPIHFKLEELTEIFRQVKQSINSPGISELEHELNSIINPFISEIYQIARNLKFELMVQKFEFSQLDQFIHELKAIGKQKYESNLYSEDKFSPLNVSHIEPEFDVHAEELNGYQIINKFFDLKLEQDQRVIAFGEDVGKIGDVNQGFAGLQDKYGRERVFDAGIREWTIIGQAIGASIRGLRPIAEIQYLDYLLYAMSPLSDDLATIRYRTNGIQQAPTIIRSRGHRLEGIWHAGSPMGLIINSMKGIHLCVPRNMVQAAGLYNTLLKGNDPGIVIECLNGYRLKEKLPSNLGTYTIPLGKSEILQEGSDLTIVSYGSTLKEVMKSIATLKKLNISAEVIDIQTLMPFDLDNIILNSLKKTNRILFTDEDVPGGATSYMLTEVIDNRNGYRYLDAKPACLSAKNHRTPFGSDGDYFTKPTCEDIVEAVLKLKGE